MSDATKGLRSLADFDRDIREVAASSDGGEREYGEKRLHEAYAEALHRIELLSSGLSVAGTLIGEAVADVSRGTPSEDAVKAGVEADDKQTGYERVRHMLKAAYAVDRPVPFPAPSEDAVAVALVGYAKNHEALASALTGEHLYGLARAALVALSVPSPLAGDAEAVSEQMVDCALVRLTAEDFWLDVEAEIERATAKWPDESPEHRITALAGEVGELAQAITKQRGTANVREEAVQVAAMAFRVLRAHLDAIPNAREGHPDGR